MSSGPAFFPHPSACPPTSPEKLCPALTEMVPVLPEEYLCPSIFAHPEIILKSSVAVPELILQFPETEKNNGFFPYPCSPTFRTPV